MYIRERLDVHLAKMRVKVQNMTDEEFTTIVNAVKTTISEKDKNLGEEFQRFWYLEFATHSYQFDRQEANIAMLATLTKVEF